MSPSNRAMAEVRRVRERHDDAVPALVHPEWAGEWPWLVQGTTTRGTPNRPFDLGIFSEGSPPAVVQRHWGRLLALTSMPGAAHARQVHGADVRFHASRQVGLRLVEPCDGHATDRAGMLLAVSVADCVPIFVVDPEARAVAVLHAGWRGAAAGVAERGIASLAEHAGSKIAALYLHLGPAICGACYEVGPEVFEALGQPRVPGPKPVDLRGVLAERLLAEGADPARVSVSEHCTRCTQSGLFSHRGGDLARQVGYMGIRA